MTAKSKQLELFHLGPPEQLPLLPYENPLPSRLGRAFFAAIPESSGVYRMRDERSRVVYVGKAKNLRNRLRSYAHASPRTAGRKVLRLIETLRTIEWDELADEKSALLEENALLRKLRPEFNVANNFSHTYLFFHLRREPEGVRVHVAMKPDPSFPDVYGAFKGLGLGFRAHKALLRLLWVKAHGIGEFARIPAPLLNRRKLPEFVVPWPAGTSETDRRLLYRATKQFLNGTAKSATETFASLVEDDALDAFTRGFLAADVETLTAFHEHHAKRNRRLKLDLAYEKPVIPQDALDDLLVLRAGKWAAAAPTPAPTS